MSRKQRRPIPAWIRIRRSELATLRRRIVDLEREKADAVREAERLGFVKHQKLMDFCLAELGQCGSYSEDEHRCNLFRGHERYSENFPHQASGCRPAREGEQGDGVIWLRSWADPKSRSMPNGSVIASSPHRPGGRGL